MGRAAETQAMHICPRCSSELVQPVQWWEKPGGWWSVELRCPACEWRDCSVYSRHEVDRFDEELDRGGQQLIEDLRSLTRANMEDQAQRFSQALAVGAVLPEDF